MLTIYRWWLLFALALMIFMINVDYTAVNIALPSIASDLHIDLNTAQWVLSIYVLTWAIAILPAGKCADKYSYNFLCKLGLILFVASSLLAGFANSSWLIISARGLQGLAAAIYAPTLYILINNSFTQDQVGTAMGLKSIGVGLGMAIGPVFGGILLQWLGWRSIFFINIPIGLLALTIISFNKDHVKEITGISNSKNNSVGVISLLLLMIMCVLGYLYFSKWLVVVFFIALLLALSLLKNRWRRLLNSISSLELFTNLAFLGCLIAFCLEQYGFSTIIICIGIYLQKIMGYSSFLAGIIYLPLTIIFSVLAVIGGILVDRMGIRYPAILGLLLVALGSIAFSWLTVNSTLYKIIIIFTLLGGGMGMAFSALNAGVMKTVPAALVGSASSLFVVFALIGDAVGISATVLIYKYISRIELLQSLSDKVGHINRSQLTLMLHSIISLQSMRDTTQLIKGGLTQAKLTLLITALMHGVSWAMMVNALISVVAACFCWKLIRTHGWHEPTV